MPRYESLGLVRNDTQTNWIDIKAQLFALDNRFETQRFSNPGAIGNSFETRSFVCELIIPHMKYGLWRVVGESDEVMCHYQSHSMTECI